MVVESYDTSLDVYNKIQLKEMELFEINIDHILSLEFNRIKPLSEGNYNSIPFETIPVESSKSYRYIALFPVCAIAILSP